MALQGSGVTLPTPKTNTPVMTTSNPSRYAQYKDQVNEVLYSKDKWAEGNASGNEALKTWAAHNADNYYKSLPKELSNMMQGMDNNALGVFYNQLTNPPPTALDNYKKQAGANPYDGQVSDMMTQLKGMVNAPNPYDQSMKDILGRLSTAIDAPIADPTTTVQYKAAQDRLNRDKAVEMNDAAELLGGSGLARSSIVTDRSQDISQKFTNYMETQVLPGIVAQLQAEKQNNIGNINTLLTGTGNEANRMDTRTKTQFDQVGKIYDAVVGQQGAWDKRVQAEFDNSMKQTDSVRADRTLENDSVRLEIESLNSAIQRTVAMGQVSPEDADVIGVPAGTPSFQAKDAAARRMQELQIAQNDIASREKIAAENNASQERIAYNHDSTSKSIADKNNAASKVGNNYSTLLGIWEKQGKAPKGLEAFGVPEGTPIGQNGLTPGQVLDQIKVDAARKMQADTAKRTAEIPGYQTSYGVDEQTAGAIYDVLQNPNREAALADLKHSSNDLRTNGIDISKVQSAIDDKWKDNTPVQPSWWDTFNGWLGGKDFTGNFDRGPLQ